MRFLRILRVAFRTRLTPVSRVISRNRRDFTGFSQIDLQYFDEDLWQQYYTEIIYDQYDKAGNSGQQSLLRAYFPSPALFYCTEGISFQPEEFVAYVKNDLGDDYYYAINQIIDECAFELYELWRQCWLFESSFETDYRFQTPEFRAALNRYEAIAIANFKRNQPDLYRKGYSWNSYAAAKERTRLTAQKFLQQTPSGITRNTRSTPFAGRSTSEALRISRQTSTRFLEENPNGRPRVVYLK